MFLASNKNKNVSVSVSLQPLNTRDCLTLSLTNIKALTARTHINFAKTQIELGVECKQI